MVKKNIKNKHNHFMIYKKKFVTDFETIATYFMFFF